VRVPAVVIFFQRHLFLYLFLFIVITIVVSSSLILKFEAIYPNSPIKTIPDAIWWSAVGVSTIGIGNVVPESTAGRYLTLFLMVAGVIIFSVITAKVASYFTEEEVKQDLDRDFAQIEGEIDRVEKNIEGEVRVDDKKVEEKVEELEKKISKLEKKK